MSNVNIGSAPLIGKLRTMGMVLLGVGAVGLGATFAVSGQERFFSDYLLGFWYFTGISVPMLFFSALQFLARAGWSASIRRVAENFTGMVPFVAIFLLPIIFNMMSHHSIYEWTHESAHSDPILSQKEPYLNMTFFLVRMGLYCLLWFGMLRFVVGNSVKQDASASDIKPTRKNWKRSSPWVLVFSFTVKSTPVLR